MQVEVPWVLGPADGRYVLRGHAGEPAHILVLRTLGAPRHSGGRLTRRRRARPVAPSPSPTPVTVTRATLVGAQPITGDPEQWLAGADLQAEADHGLAVLNAVVHAQRIAAGDPHAPVVTRERALVVRVGIGAGEQVADGRWARALDVPPATGAGGASRIDPLRPQQRLAAILGGRDVALASEELALRARADTDAGRWREAAFQVRVALEAVIAELEPWSGRGDLALRIDELRAARSPVGAAANRALEGGLDEEEIADVTHALARIEAALRARAAAELH